MDKNKSNDLVFNTAVGCIITTFAIGLYGIASLNSKKMNDFKDNHELVKIEHVVEEGETISSISAKYNCSEDLIVMDNEITNPDYIIPGQVLYIEQ